ncbi:eukaryotic translation initiation factor 3 subunit F-2 [Drosophila ficusphila]|uniref:eukaryotic translation initiation factor 3 subunit F-2 n=1 Tax=Drosophila ficusphila TaxID=30025 RepID=UPI0007E70827|nr:eukaryotic translation initiation factor 3 subunit F-2 [Drosophila ficusphila]
MVSAQRWRSYVHVVGNSFLFKLFCEKFTMSTNFNLRNKVMLQPLVLFQIIDAYERRPKDANQIMGTLLGRKNGKGGLIEITNCFVVPHKEHSDGTGIDLDIPYAADVLELNMLTYPHERVLGWFATGKAVSRCATLLHDYYSRVCGEGQPLHLLVDATLRNQRLSTRLYCAVKIGVPGGTKGLMFSILPLEMASGNAEMVALRSMEKQSLQSANKLVGRILPELVQVVDATREVQQRLDLVLRYINDVLARKKKPDNVVGRALHEALTSVPLVDSEKFRQMFNANLRDMLMAITLSTMIKTQLQISEKLSSMNDRQI